MRILFCAYDTPGLVASGPNAWIQRLIPDLRVIHGMDVEVLFVYKESLETCPTINFFKANNLPYHLISRTKFPFIEDQLKLLLQVVKAKSFDMLVANLVIPALYSARYLNKSNIPVVGVLHSHDQFYDSVIYNFGDRSSKGRLTEFVAVSDYIKKKYFNPKSNLQCSVIPCGTRLPQIEFNKELDSSLKIVYAGRLVKEAKQIERLVERFIKTSQADPRLEFTIYGSGEEKDKVVSRISDEKGHKVTYGGVIPPEKILSEVSKHHVFTLMSDYEGMPIALMEAMACGLVPVCYVGQGGIHEIIDEGKNGFVLNSLEDDYLGCLQKLINNPDIYSQLSKNARIKIIDEFSSEVTSSKWAKLLWSYATNSTAYLRIPWFINLPKERLYYGDARKPSIYSRFKISFESNWLKLRLFVRPRARLRTVFQLIKRNNK
ncbi:glycosyltransferase family 4 protein [Winogradskyella aurantiaca]|uniref:glycosyltransferase family 4 protein n=1 Tax=Winogradskyella aurantiaca TaxID=2219558 RepID=UPI000E1D1897|nr:glycosyltransferase family 4 protein [Winogradskyella aurantiaca]